MDYNALQKVLIDGVPFLHSFSEAQLSDAMSAVQSARMTVNARRATLSESIIEGNLTGELDARQWLMTSSEALLVSAIAANKKLRPARRRNLESCLQAAELIDFATPMPESVPVRFKAKKGGWRAIHDPGLHHRTAQHSIVRVLSEYLKPRTFQFTHVGVQAAIKAVKAAIESGHYYVARLDIKEFYASFSSDELVNELPLPPEVVEHAVVGRRMKVVVDQGSGRRKLNPHLSSHSIDLLALARLGIPAGSGSSPIVGMVTMSQLAWVSTHGVILVNYADDFLLLATSAELLDEAIGELICAVGDLPGGHFELKCKSVSNVAQGVDFLGHSVRLVDSSVKIAPTKSNMNALYGRLDQLDTKFGKLVFYPGKKDMAAALTCAAEMHVLIKGWMATFAACDHMSTRWAAAPLKTVEDALHTLGATATQLDAAIQPWMKFKSRDFAPSSP